MKPRYSPRLSIPSIAMFSTSDGVGHSHIHDLSVPDCRLETTTVLRVGQTVNLQLMFMPAQVQLRIPLAVVRWVEPPWAGLEFISMSPDQAQLRWMAYRDPVLAATTITGSLMSALK